MSMMVSFVLSFFPRDVLDEILNLIESVSEDFPSYSFSSYDSVPVLVSVDWRYSRKTQCWRKGHVFYFVLILFLYIYIRPPSSAHH